MVAFFNISIHLNTCNKIELCENGIQSKSKARNKNIKKGLKSKNRRVITLNKNIKESLKDKNQRDITFSRSF